MRQFVLSLVILLEAGSAGYAQNDSGGLQGVYSPPQSGLGKLRGVYGTPQSAPAVTLPSTLSAPDYGTAERGPAVSLPGDVPRVRRYRKASNRVQSRIDLAMAVRWSMIVPPLLTSAPIASSSIRTKLADRT